MEMLYKLFYSYAMSIILRFSSNKNDAEEILNDSFLKCFDNIKSYDPAKPFKTWFRRIVVNTSIDYYRKNLKFMDNQNIDDINYLHSDYDSVNGLNVEDLLKLLTQLPEMYRIIFNLYEIEGYKHEEIAEKLNIATSSSRTYLMRAKKILQELYNKNFNINNHVQFI